VARRRGATRSPSLCVFSQFSDRSTAHTSVSLLRSGRSSLVLGRGTCLAVEEAASREWLEETSIAHGEMIGITGSYANGKGHVLVAVQFKPIMLAQWKQAILCPENSDFGMWCPANYDQPPLGFPIHQRIAQSWALEYA
jgi:hypothetical protein